MIIIPINSASIEVIKEKLEKAPENSIEKANFTNQLCNWYYNKQQYSKAIQLKKNALQIYLVLNDRRNVAISYEYLSIFYSEIADFEKSLICSFKGIKAINKKKERNLYFSILLNLGTTYIEAGNNKKGIFYLEKALHHFYQIKDNKRLAAIYSNIGIAFLDSGEINKSITTLQKALQIANKHNFSSIKAATHRNLGDLYLKIENYSKALDSYILSQNFYSKIKDERGIWQSKLGMADVYKNIGKEQLSLQIYKNCIKHFKTKNELIELSSAYKNTSEIYSNLNNLSKAFHYYKTYQLVKDKLSTQEVKDKMTILQMKFDNDRLEKLHTAKIELLEKSKKISTLKMYVLLAIIAFIALISFFIYTKNKYQQKLILASENEKKHLKEELNYRFSELESFALHIVQKNNLLNELKKDFKLLKTSKSIASDLKSITLKINNSIKMNQDITLFSKRIDELNSSFYKILDEKFPDLTNNEKKLCTLIKLNLSSKEIAILNSVTEGAITMARYRLRKKLNLDHDINLTEYLQKILEN